MERYHGRLYRYRSDAHPLMMEAFRHYHLDTWPPDGTSFIRFLSLYGVLVARWWWYERASQRASNASKTINVSTILEIDKF